MFTKSRINSLCVLAALAQCCSGSLFSDPLTPRTPVPITNDGLVNSPISVAGTTEGFLAVWQTSSYEVESSFSSDQGASWRAPVQIDTGSIFIVSACAKDSTFVTIWTRANPGFSNGTAYASASSNQGISWSTPVIVSPPSQMDPGGNVTPFTPICATEAGYMASWISNDVGTLAVWANFSSDGLNWGTPHQVTIGPEAAQYGTIAVGGNQAGFLTAWQENDSHAYVSFSANNGASWSAPVQVSAATNLHAQAKLAVCGSSAGFMIGWVDQAFDAYTSFSTNNGATWSTPTLLASNLEQFDNGISLSATSAGFVAAWQDNMNNIHGSFSSNQGNTWSAPALVGNMDATNWWGATTGVSATGGNCMFTWIDNTNNALSSYSPFPGAAPASSPLISPFVKQVTPCKPGSGLFN